MLISCQRVSRQVETGSRILLLRASVECKLAILFPVKQTCQNQKDCLSQPNTSGLFGWKKVRVKKFVPSLETLGRKCVFAGMSHEFCRDVPVGVFKKFMYTIAPMYRPVTIIIMSENLQ